MTRRGLRQGYTDLKRHSLILCASLVQNPENVGGLCRLAEVFRLESLVVSSLAIAQEVGFRKTAVSSHHWQPLMECSTEALSAWCATQRQRNYTLIALDANTCHPTITTFTMPPHVVFLLGRELTGIPDHILHSCDRTVTIPQYGVVESLNVQQAAAIAIYEYIRQHGLPSSMP